MKHFKNRKIIFVFAAALLVALVTIVPIFSQYDPKLEKNLVSIHRGNFEVKVATIGTLDTARAYELLSGIRGDRGKIIKIIDDGAKVKKGQPLITFDPTFFEMEVQRLSGEIKSRTAVAEYTHQLMQLVKSEGEKTISNAQLELSSTRQEYQRYKNYISELNTLESKGYEISSEIVQAEQKAAQASLVLKKGETDLSRLKREAAFKAAQALAEYRKATTELETAQLSLADIKAEEEKTVLRSPADGFVVLHENIAQGDQKHKLRVGDSVWQGQPILYLPDSSSMLVKTQIREMDLHHIKPGMEASVSVDAYPDAQFTGTVEKIGVLAVENSGGTDKNFQFSVLLHGTDERLRPGMTARVFITVDRVQDALTMPVSALYSEGSGDHCFVYDGSKFSSRLVHIGKMNDDVVEIRSGLVEGERVSLVKP